MLSMYSEHWPGQKSVHVALDVVAYNRYFLWITGIETLLNKHLEKLNVIYVCDLKINFFQIKGQFIPSDLFIDTGY